MLFRTLLVTCLFTCTSLLAGFKYELGICAIFKDDVKYLPEWIEFHEKQGVQHFWLYNNGLGGKRDYIDYLEPYIISGLVDVIEWPFEFEEYSDWCAIQIGSYNDCIENIQEICKWCAFIDSDEFLFSPTGKTLPEILIHFDRFKGVGANWVLYGTSNIEQIPDGEKITDYLLYRSALDFEKNRYIKSILQPKNVKSMASAHHAIFKKGYFCVDEQMGRIKGISTIRPKARLLRINHYWARDLDFFHNVKLPSVARRYGNVEAQIEQERDHLNQVYDPIITQFN